MQVLRSEFRKPRDILLSMVADFLTRATSRLAELNRKLGETGKPFELLDIRSHVVSTFFVFLIGSQLNRVNKERFAHLRYY